MEENTMPAPLSNDLRVRILLAYKNGKTVKEIKEEFYVGQNTVYCLLRLFKETGSHEARENNCGRKPMLTEDDLKNIENKILETPDITLEELKERLSLTVSISALCRTINKKLGLIYKKKLCIRQHKTVRT